MLQIMDMRMGFPCPCLNVAIDFFSHSCLKMCNINVKHIRNATFLGCLVLMFCDIIGNLMLEWACPTLEGRTALRLMSNLADISVSRVRNRR